MVLNILRLSVMFLFIYIILSVIISCIFETKQYQVDHIKIKCYVVNMIEKFIKITYDNLSTKYLLVF